MKENESFGFIFAFKVYHSRHESDQSYDKPKNYSCLADQLENLVHCITRSDIIHVELIPVLGSRVFLEETHHHEIFLTISPTAYSAYVGVGFDEHDSSFCTTDPTYRLVYIPMSYETMMRGIEYLQSQRGKKYNYFALPLTVLVQKA